jgi:bacillithiol system protein YtxJ
MGTITEWTRPEEVEAFLAARGTGLILKHSTRCSISASARREFDAFASSMPGAPLYVILVIESRPASNALAQKLGVAHQSPQAILVRDGAAVWSATHFAITKEDLVRAWDGTASNGGDPTG